MKMTNVTNKNQTEFMRFEEVSWIVPEAINILLIVIDIWAIICLVYFGIKTKKWHALQRKYTEKLDAGLIYSACVGCTVALLFRLISSQLAFNVGFDGKSHHQCEAVYDASFVLYGVVLLFVYMFLWFRQRVFYANQMLNVTYSKTVRVFSASSIFLIIGSGISVIVLNTLPDNYPSTPSGCIYLATNDTHDTWSVLSGVVVLVVGQVILLGLFIYPLSHNRFLIDWNSFCKCYGKKDARASTQTVQSDRNSTVCTIEMNGNSNNNGQNKTKQQRRQSVASSKIVSIMRRTIIIAVINIVLDLLVTALSFFVFEDGTARRISIMVYDINLFIGVMLVLVTLSSARDIFKSPIKGVELSSITS